MDLAIKIAQIEEPAHRRIPIQRKVADVDEFLVPHPDGLSLPPRAAKPRTYVIVHNDAGDASIVPRITITRLT